MAFGCLVLTALPLLLSTAPTAPATILPALAVVRVLEPPVVSFAAQRSREPKDPRPVIARDLGEAAVHMLGLEERLRLTEAVVWSPKLDLAAGGVQVAIGLSGLLD
jgi:hypothetical protein